MTDEELDAVWRPVAQHSAEAIRLGLAAGPDDAMRGRDNLTLVRYQWVTASAGGVVTVGPARYTMAGLWRVMKQYEGQHANAFLSSETHAFDLKVEGGRLAFAEAFRELAAELREAVA